MRGRPWSPLELELLRELYPDLPTADVAALLDRCPGSVYQAANLRGIAKSAQFLASVASGRIQLGKLHPKMIASRFQKGLTPWNKGKAYNAGGKSVNTQFKTGTRAGAALRNFVPIGTYRVNGDGLLQQKVTATGYAPKDWKSVSSLVWAKEHGPVPAGSIVVFKPGQRTTNPAELTVDRLECITRAENAKRNHPANRDPELAKLIQLKGAITRQLNRIEREHEHAAHQ
jgi:hypothetical protein